MYMKMAPGGAAILIAGLLGGGAGFRRREPEIAARQRRAMSSVGGRGPLRPPARKLYHPVWNENARCRVRWDCNRERRAMSKQVVVGILAHVDASRPRWRAMLFNAGRIRQRGRVDDGDSHLDTNTIERERGITIFSSQASARPRRYPRHARGCTRPRRFSAGRSARCARSTTRFWW